MKKLLLICAIFSAVTQLSAQCLMYPVLLSQRIPNSNLVVEGKVINQICFWNAEHNRIYTSNLIDVYKSFKGNAGPYIEVITEGGTIGNKKHVFDPTLELEVGDMGVFTLNSNVQPAQFAKPVYEAYASAQGFIKYDVVNNKATEPFNTYTNISGDLYNTINQLTGIAYSQVKPVNPFQQTVTNTNSTQAVAAISSFTPTTITAGTFSVLTINGSAFGTSGTVGFRNSDDGGSTTYTLASTASEVVSWSPTQIQVKVPSKAGTGYITVNGVNSSGSLTIPYSHLNVSNSGLVFNTKHISQGSGGYVWTYNTTFYNTTAAKAAFERSMNSWRCATLINWTLASTTSAVTASASDNINIVTFNSSLGTGILGQCGSYFSGCGSGSSMQWFVDELDIQFDPTPGTLTWQYGPTNANTSQYDFESVTVHELGHGHQLGHVINSSDLMHYALSNGQNKRTINADDLSGGLAVMNRNTQAGGTCSNPLMTPLSASTCSLGTLNSAFSIGSPACVGLAMSLTDGSAGSPSTWSWSMPGGTPATASASNTSVTYATAGVKTISLTVTSGTASSTSTQTINVVAPPTLSVTPTATTICTGQFTVLKATGATSYAWNPGSTSGSSNVVTPTATTTYTVVGTSNGCASIPYTVVVTLSTCTGLEDLTTHNDILVYPNPSNGLFTISSVANTGKLDVSVVNMLGQTVKSESSKNPKEVVVDMSSFSKGVYYMKIQMNDGAKLVKVVLD